MFVINVESLSRTYCCVDTEYCSVTKRFPNFVNLDIYIENLAQLCCLFRFALQSAYPASFKEYKTLQYTL